MLTQLTVLPLGHTLFDVTESSTTHYKVGALVLCHESLTEH